MDTNESKFTSALLEFDFEKAKQVIINEIENKNEVIPALIEKVLSNIGSEWEKGELALSQVYMSGVICEKIIDEIFKNANTYNGNENCKIGIVTFSDFHALGKKIVLSVLRSVGFNIVDFGHGVDTETLVDKIKKEKIEILLISVLMLPSALRIKDLKNALARENIHVKILVGGAPFIFDNSLWKDVGADAMAKIPSDAIEILNNWLNN